MKFLRVFLSLHSIQLIVISVLLMTYLAVTAVNRPNKAETVQAIPSTEEENTRGADAESLNRGKSIKAIISQPTATGIILETPAGSEAAPVTGQVISISNAEVVAESLENESGSAAGPLLVDRRATMR